MPKELRPDGIKAPGWPAVGLLALLAAACQQGQAEPAARPAPPPVVVQTVTLSPASIPRSLIAVGSLQSPQSTQLAAEFAGKVVFLDIPEGREVAAGHVLARLDEEQARAAVDIAAARQRNARDTLDRLRALHGKALISQQELDDATTDLQAATGQLDDASTRLGKAAITAPFAGVLGLRQVSLGAYLNPGDPVVRLTQAAPLHLLFNLPQHHVGELAVGQVVRGVVGSCGTRFAARVSVIDPQVDPGSRSVQVQAVVPNEDGALRPGMAATVKVEVQSIDNALMIPQEAVLRQGTRKLVYTVGADGTAAPQEVELGQFFADDVQITRGLEPGATVVARGHQKLRPGSKVESETYAPIANPNLQLGSHTADASCDF